MKARGNPWFFPRAPSFRSLAASRVASSLGERLRAAPAPVGRGGEFGESPWLRSERLVIERAPVRIFRGGNLVRARYHPAMARARRHQRLLSVLAFGLLALAAELAGRSLVHRVDLGRHVSSPGYARTDYYPILLAIVKGGIALMLALLLWRVLRARAAERGALRLLGGRRRMPKLRLQLTPRVYLAFFLLTSAIFLVQADAEGAELGRWPLLSPWLHSSALPVFAVLGVLCALVWCAVRDWLADYEEYAQQTVARARLLVGRGVLRTARPRGEGVVPPRSIFGLAFESRPPPLAA